MGWGMTHSNGSIYKVENQCQRHQQRRALQRLSKSDQEQGDNGLNTSFRNEKVDITLGRKQEMMLNDLTVTAKDRSRKMPGNTSYRLKTGERRNSWPVLYPLKNSVSSETFPQQINKCPQRMASLVHFYQPFMEGKNPQTHPENKNRGNSSKFMRSA